MPVARVWPFASQGLLERRRSAAEANGPYSRQVPSGPAENAPPIEYSPPVPELLPLPPGFELHRA
ncbi:hypothetical protein OHT57_31310 [Streptomyces sp. NBC_00285]|uniref:hypothetical protein n=1 Tax=Streptomyces sp. NBC_00285 TaxID=2975700 RepID=UPI002E2C648F|nr:hypothetical protein [Streptomyces sp. NBC_00285]